MSANRAAPGGMAETSQVSQSVRVVQGDAIDVLATVAAGTFDAVVTDPPHEILDCSWDVMPPIALWQQLRRVLKPGGMLIAIAAARTYHRLASVIEAAGFAIEDMGVWCFAGGRPPAKSRLKPAHSPILFARAPGPRAPLNLDEARIPYLNAADAEQTKRIDTLRAGGTRRPAIYDDGMNTNGAERSGFVPKAGRWPANLMITEPHLAEHDRFFLVPRVRDSSGHPATKPVQLLSHLIRAFVPQGGTIVDPFAGGGTTGVAASLTGRSALLIERIPRYASEAARRVAEAEPFPVLGERTGADSAAPSSNPLADLGITLTSNNEYLQDTPKRASLNEQSNLKTQKEIAAEFRISTRTVRRLMDDKVIPWIQVGRRAVRFDAHQVRAALNRRGTRDNVPLSRSPHQDLGRPASAHAAERQEVPGLPADPRQGERREEAGSGA